LVIVFKGKYYTSSNLKGGTKSGGRSITKRTQIEGASADLIYLSTVFHGFSKDEIDGFQKEVKRLLKPNAVLAIVEIKKEETPFGPPLDIRFSPDELKEAITLKPKSLVEVGEYFYMLIFENIT